MAKNNTTIESAIEDIKWLTVGEDENYYYGWFDLDKFYNYIKDQHEKRDGFYSWNGLRYFLFEYELNLQDKANGNVKLEWSDFNKRKKEDTIEHIYPKTPKDKCWTSVFNKYTEKQRKIILHSLGNLVPLARSKNSELQNKCFDFKKKHTNKQGNEVGFFNGAYSEIEVSSFDDWTPKEILARGIDMLEFLEKRWDIDFNDEWGEDGKGIDKRTFMRLNFIKDK